MLKVIENTLNNLEKDKVNVSNKIKAETILDIALKMGMLPPKSVDYDNFYTHINPFFTQEAIWDEDMKEA